MITAAFQLIAAVVPGAAAPGWAGKEVAPIVAALQGFEVLMILAIIGAAIVGGVLSWQAEQKRRTALRDWAGAGGWSFDESKRSGTRYPFPLFNTGHSRYSRFHAARPFAGVIDGVDEPALFDAFEYHYAVTSSNGKSSSTTHYYFACLAVQSGVEMGEVSIRDEHMGDRIAGVFGANDIDFEDPDFSKRFHVRADRRKDAFDLIDHAMMSHMMGYAGQGLSVFTLGTLLFVSCSGRADPRRYDGLVRFAGGFLRQLPRTMVNAARARRGLAPMLEAGAAATRARLARDGGAAPARPASSVAPEADPDRSPDVPPGAADESRSVPSRNPDPDGPARLF